MARPLRAIGVLVDETEHHEALQRHAGELGEVAARGAALERGQVAQALHLLAPQLNIFQQHFKIITTAKGIDIR